MLLGRLFSVKVCRISKSCFIKCLFKIVRQNGTKTHGFDTNETKRCIFRIIVMNLGESTKPVFVK